VYQIVQGINGLLQIIRQGFVLKFVHLVIRLCLAILKRDDACKLVQMAHILIILLVYVFKSVLNIQRLMGTIQLIDVFRSALFLQTSTQTLYLKNVYTDAPSITLLKPALEDVFPNAHIMR
jgi:hypothetical protein